MTDHAEEQEMEAEAMAAIFDTNFEIISVDQNNNDDSTNDHHNRTVWRITIFPETGTTDEQELETLNHVACRLLVTLPETYPEILPDLDVEIVKGLVSEHQEEIHRIAMEEASNNLGTPSIYAITERVREWLIENNTKGLDDVSMHAQMIRKQLLEEKSKVCDSVCVCFSHPQVAFFQKSPVHTLYHLSGKVSSIHLVHCGSTTLLWCKQQIVYSEFQDPIL
jgi:RWD domain